MHPDIRHTGNHRCGVNFGVVPFPHRAPAVRVLRLVAVVLALLSAAVTLRALLAPALPGSAVLDLAGAAGLLPFEYFHVHPIYGAIRARELHDFFVQLVPLTEVEPWRPEPASAP